MRLKGLCCDWKALAPPGRSALAPIIPGSALAIGLLVAPCAPGVGVAAVFGGAVVTAPTVTVTSCLIAMGTATTVAICVIARRCW